MAFGLKKPEVPMMRNMGPTTAIRVKRPHAKMMKPKLKIKTPKPNLNGMFGKSNI